MGKPGEMVQILRENYEEQLEAYRLLRNKFLIAVPGMNLDKEKQLYESWKVELHLNSIIDFDRKIARPPEPRTCETCGTGDIPHCVTSSPCRDDKRYWTPRSPQSADVEMVREALDHGVAIYEGMEKIGVDGADKVLGLFKSAIAALDRIVGVLRGSV